MRINLEETYPWDILNQIKRDSNEMEADFGVDLLNLIELGLIEVIGIENEMLVYKTTDLGHSLFGKYEEAKTV